MVRLSYLDGQKYNSSGYFSVPSLNFQGRPHLYTDQTDMSLSVWEWFILSLIKLAVAFGAFDQLASDLIITQAAASLLYSTKHS